MSKIPGIPKGKYCLQHRKDKDSKVCDHYLDSRCTLHCVNVKKDKDYTPLKIPYCLKNTKGR